MTAVPVMKPELELAGRRSVMESEPELVGRRRSVIKPEVELGGRRRSVLDQESEFGGRKGSISRSDVPSLSRRSSVMSLASQEDLDCSWRVWRSSRRR